MRRRVRGVAAVGVGFGVGALAVRRRRVAERAPAVTSAVPAPVGRPGTVTTQDGLSLAVVEHGTQDDPSATVVLAHGYVQSSALWSGQVRDLLEARPDLRVVVYDHRGHGRSDRTPRERATIAQLGRDLARVVEAVAPTGPVVLVGHSMGGMTLMALAEQHAELVADRVVAAAFLGTSAGGLSSVTYGLPAPVAKVLRRALPKANERAVRTELAGRPRRVGALDAWLVFPRGADPALVDRTLEVHRGCSAETVAAFAATFADHDRQHALAALAAAQTLVVVGDRDVLCPVGHSRALAAALPGSELVVYPGVGHMVHLERRAEVSRALVSLVDRALSRPLDPRRSAVS